MIPIYYVWDGECMRPLTRFHNVCNSQFVVGQEYKLEVVQVPDERTEAEHKHYMASVAQAWRNLPEKMAAEYPSPDSLRKRALIKTGFYHEKSTVCDSPKQALRMAAFIRPLNDYDVVLVRGCIIKHYRAKSQSHARAGGMDKEEFRRSKEAVLELLADYIGVTKTELAKEGKS